MKKTMLSLTDEREEKKRVHKIEKYKILPNLWIAKQNTRSEWMLQKQLFYKRDIKNNVNILLGNEHHRKRKFLTLRKRNIKKTTIIGKNKSLPTDVVNKLIKKIGKNVQTIKNSITDITKMNELFLEKNARKTISSFRLQNKKNKLLENINKREDSLNTEENKEKVDDKYNKTQTLTKNKRIKIQGILKDKNNNKKENENQKVNYLRNFLLVNDNYRKQLNAAFLKYNPKTHLENLKFLVQSNPLIRKDLIQIKDEIDEDIKWRCDKFHYKKKYEILKNKFQRSNSVQNTPKIPYKKNNILSELNKKKPFKIFSPRMSTKNLTNIFKKKKKDENAKFIFPKEEKIEELNYMIKASSEIDNLIKEENINKKIDMFETNYEEKKIKLLNEIEDSNASNSLLEKNYFEDDEKKVIKALGNVYQYQVDKHGKEKEKKLKEKIKNDDEEYKKTLKEEKIDEIYKINDIISDNFIL